MTDDDRRFYVYALQDPALWLKTNDPVLSTFYIGKGTDNRIEVHEKEAETSLDMSGYREKYDSKTARIRQILQSGGQVRAVIVSDGYLDSRDAEHAEALAIATVNAALKAAGLPRLTNASHGVAAGFYPADDRIVYTKTTEVELTGQAQLPARAILVKGTAKPASKSIQRLAPQEEVPAVVRRFGDRVRALHLVDDDEERRGWDPYAPWHGEEAADRGRRYWPIGVGRVAGWLDDPASMPQHLLLAIPAGDGRTTVRYAWTIDPSGTWDYYPQIQRWAVPLGSQVVDHPLRGKALYEHRAGKRVQVLLNHASGIRVIDPGEFEQDDTAPATGEKR